MLQWSYFDQFTAETLMLMAALTALAAGIIGYITDGILGRRGFGPVGNGLLAVVGCLVGVYARHTLFGRVGIDDTLITGGLAATAATGMLLVLGMVKHWVSD